MQQQECWPNICTRDLSPEQWRTVRHRLRIVIKWERAIAKGREAKPRRREVEVTAEFLATERPGVCRSTLSLWRQAYRSDGPIGLIDHRQCGPSGKRQRRPKAVKLLSTARRSYEKSVKQTMAGAHWHALEIALREEWPTCTLRETKRFLRDVVLPHIQRQAGAGLERTS